MAPIIIVSDLDKSYSQPDSAPLAVLQGASFSLDAGATLSVTGPSGSGKSTLLALLAGLDRPDRGRIELAGQELTSMTEAELTRFRAGHIGIVFQQFHLMPHLTAEENICLPLELLRRPNVAEAIDNLLDSVGLRSRRHHLPGQLSGGECQRVAIARALAVRPDILLADEPTGNLDARTGREVADLLFHLVTEHHMTLIVVTHNQGLAARCDQHLLLAGGVLR